MSNGFQISLIDDDMEDVFLIKRAFSKVAKNTPFNYLGSGVTFLNRLEENSIEMVWPAGVLLLDINMPKVNGFDVLRALQTTSMREKCKVFMLTTTAANKERDKCFALGADYFLSKPSSFSELEQLAKRVVDSV